MAYNCYLGEMLVPTPAKLTVKIKGKNQTVSLLNEGEINFLRAPGLTEITLPLTLPMLGGVQRPEYYLFELERLKVEKATTRFKMLRTAPNGALLFNTDIKVSVEDYTIKEDAKNGLDLSVDVSLKQYRDYGTKTVTISDDSSGDGASQTVSITTERDASSAPKAETHTVQKGDTLWSLAKKYYGDGSKYNVLYEANKDVITDPNVPGVGQSLTIPQMYVKL